MNKLLLLGILALGGCSTMAAPAPIEAIHQATMSRITYQNYAKKDWRYVAPGEKGAGNCAVYAMTNLIDLNNAGYNPRLVTCHTAKGVGHAYTQVDGWALDNRFKWVIPMSEQDCK